MKNTFIIAMCIFWGFVIAVVSAGYVVKQNRIAQEEMQKKYTGSLKQITEITTSPTQEKVLSSNEVKAVVKEVVIKTPPVNGGVVAVKPVPTVVNEPKVVPNQTASLTMNVVATHNTQNDCWIVINGKVYSVTSYIPMHPGGAKRIVRLCGANATSGYDGQGHSKYADSLLGQYLVGTLQ